MREAPWVLSDVLRAKRKNGVEGRKERKIVMASWRGYEKVRVRGWEGEGEEEGAERTRVLSSGAHTGAPRR